MSRIQSLLLHASGADLQLLEQCPTEKNKYAGIGATVIFTGLLAALAAGYAFFTVFDNYIAAIALGLVWGLMIFNLDRYIVSSMRKHDRFGRELLMAAPRLVLAILISLVIAKPLELKIFDKEIQAELSIMEEQLRARQVSEINSRYDPELNKLKAEREELQSQLTTRTAQRDELRRIAREEADGTGGSRIKNTGPIYEVKKADADRADKELDELRITNTARMEAIDQQMKVLETERQQSIDLLKRGLLSGPAARLEALHRLTEHSDAIAWANLFIILLFIMVECSPILVKLLSEKGPYDSLLRQTEHGFVCREAEAIAIASHTTRENTAALGDAEHTFVNRKLNAELR